MRAKQSSTPSKMYSGAPAIVASLAIRAPDGFVPLGNPPSALPGVAMPGVGLSGVAQREGLLHDARNLMGALGLYCDLLASHGVLKAEHLHYAEDMRLLGARSGALIERLILSLAGTHAEAEPVLPQRVNTNRPESLREIASRCSGMLSRVAGGRNVELTYGPAAAAWTSAGREDVERILVNLVRNAGEALDATAALDAAAASSVPRDLRRSDARPAGEASSAALPAHSTALSPGTVRIGIGMLENRVGDPSPWPFRRVHLTVEDSGCGMAPAQLERLLRNGRGASRGNHGIGFRVVQELVAGGGGDLRVMSTVGVGTRVQIEWPVWSAAGGPVAGSSREASC